MQTLAEIAVYLDRSHAYSWWQGRIDMKCEIVWLGVPTWCHARDEISQVHWHTASDQKPEVVKRQRNEAIASLLHFLQETSNYSVTYSCPASMAASMTVTPDLSWLWILAPELSSVLATSARRSSEAYRRGVLPYRRNIRAIIIQ